MTDKEEQARLERLGKDKSVDRERVQKEEQSSERMEYLKNRVGELLIMLKYIREHPNRYQKTLQMSYLKELVGLTVEINELFKTTENNRFDAKLANILSSISTEVAQTKESTNGRPSVDYEPAPGFTHGGRQYDSLAAMESAILRDALSLLKIGECKEHIAENKEEFGKLKKLMHDIGILENPEDLAEQKDKTPFRKHYMQITSVLATNEVLIEDSVKQLALQQETTLQFAKDRGINADNIDELAEKISLMEKTGPLPDWVKEVKELVKECVKESAELAHEKAEQTKLKTYYERLEQIRAKHNIEISPTEMIATLIQQKEDYGLSQRIVEKAQERLEIKQQDLQQKMQEERIKAQEEQKGKEDLSLADDETRSMAVDIGKQWGIPVEELRGKSTAQVFGMLEEKLQKDQTLFAKYPDTRELFDFIKEEVSGNAQEAGIPKDLGNTYVQQPTDIAPATIKQDMPQNLADIIGNRTETNKAERLTESSNAVSLVSPVTAKEMDTMVTSKELISGQTNTGGINLPTTARGRG